ncbi:MAG: hypothetical protein J6R77_01105, partial [Clostridia bacterium]|nr:hypothetical protein [Clostridia bacterium]
MKNREFHAAMLQLSPENRRVLRRMARYLDSYALNEVAYEELMSDLTGMALECQQRQQPFSEAVGMDEVAFCHELVANCPRETFLERLLGACRWVILWVAFVLPVMMLLEVIFTWMPGSCEGLLYHTPLSFLLKYCTTAVLVSCGLFFLKRMSYYSKTFISTIYLVVFLVAFITVSEVCTYLLGGMQVS